MDEISFIVMKIVISICAALVSVYVIPYFRRLSQNEKAEELLTAVDIAIKAAEQTIKGSGKGAEKKEMALKYASEWLKGVGITISTEQLDGMIEAAVYGMNTGKE